MAHERDTVVFSCFTPIISGILLVNNQIWKNASAHTLLCHTKAHAHSVSKDIVKIKEEIVDEESIQMKKKRIFVRYTTSVVFI